MKVHHRIYCNNPEEADRAYEAACEAFKRCLKAYLMDTPKKKIRKRKINHYTKTRKRICLSDSSSSELDSLSDITETESEWIDDRPLLPITNVIDIIPLNEYTPCK
jgi:hypothetical protein